MMRDIFDIKMMRDIFDIDLKLAMFLKNTVSLPKKNALGKKKVFDKI